MKKLQLAVISDLHVGEGARAKDLCPAGAPSRDMKPDENYRERFLEFVQKHSLKADYLVLPGDVTDRAKPEEVKIASDFIEEARIKLGVEKENVVFVPGNHDVDWSVFETPDTTGVRRSQRYAPIRSENFGFNAIIARGNGCVFDAPHFTIWSDSNVMAVGYNSSHHDEPKKFHHGLIDATHIGQIRAALKAMPRNKEQLRLFLVHHHLLQYDDPTPTHPDTSIMVNSEQLQALLREFDFDILIHGHRHLPRFTTHSVNGSREVAILCAGSFSVEIDTRWTGSISNQFHLITVEGRDKEEHLITGEVESWSYNFVRGWVESDENYDGIPHIEPFGTYIRPEKLKAALHPLLMERFSKADYIEWSEVLAAEPQLRHLRPTIVLRVLDDLAADANFRRVHDIPDKIILLKGKT